MKLIKNNLLVLAGVLILINFVAGGEMSLINNTGTTDIYGYLLMTVDYWNTTTLNWQHEASIVNESSPRRINSSDFLALDTIWADAGSWNTLNYTFGTYRVYVKLRDPEGTILKNNDGSWMNATYNFTLLNLPPNIILLSPPNNTSNNTNLITVFNVTDNEGDNVNCSLYINGILNITNSSVQLGNLTTLIGVLSSDGEYYWNISCNDGTTTSWSETRLYTYDTTNPIITWNFPRDDNSSIVSNNSLNLNIGFSDTNLYQALVNITNSSDNSLYENYQFDLNTTSYNETTPINVTNWADGTYTVNAVVSDDHTKGEWNPETTVTKRGDKLTFLFEKKNQIGIEVLNVITPSLGKQSKLNYFKEKKEPNKYTFSLGFNEKIKTYDLKITADKIVQRNTEYNGHLVLNDHYWFDTEPYNSVVKKIGKGYIILTIFNNDKNTSEFSSLGGLNIVSENVTFRIDRTPPKITKYLPVDSTNVLTPVTFTAFVSDFTNVKNVTLCIKKDGSAEWDYYLYNYSGLNNFNYTFSESLMISSAYYWDFYTCDNLNSCSYSTEGNWSFYVYGFGTTTTTISPTTTTTLRSDLTGGIMKIIYDDLTLGNHKISLYQKSNYTNSSGGEAWRYNYITSFSQRETYATYNEKLGEGITYLIKVQDQKTDFLSSPEKLQGGIFHNLGYLIAILLVITISIILYKKIK